MVHETNNKQARSLVGLSFDHGAPYPKHVQTKVNESQLGIHPLEPGQATCTEVCSRKATHKPIFSTIRIARPKNYCQVISPLAQRSVQLSKISCWHTLALEDKVALPFAPRNN